MPVWGGPLRQAARAFAGMKREATCGKKQRGGEPMNLIEFRASVLALNGYGMHKVESFSMIRTNIPVSTGDGCLTRKCPHSLSALGVVLLFLAALVALLGDHGVFAQRKQT